MNIIVIDCGLFTEKSHMHKAIRDAIGSDNYHGNNLDSLHDALSSLCSPTVIEFVNFLSAYNYLDDYCDSLVRLFADVTSDNSNLKIKISY